MAEVNLSTTISLWGRRSVDWVVLPSMDHSGGIVIIWDDQVLELTLKWGRMLFMANSNP